MFHVLKGKTSTFYSLSWLNIWIVTLLSSLYLQKVDSYSTEENTIWLLFGSLDTDDDLRDDSDVFPLMTSVKLWRKQWFAVCFFPSEYRHHVRKLPNTLCCMWRENRWRVTGATATSAGSTTWDFATAPAICQHDPVEPDMLINYTWLKASDVP